MSALWDSAISDYPIFCSLPLTPGLKSLRLKYILWQNYFGKNPIWSYTPDGKYWHPSPFSRCFSCKTAFLKWIFEADPVGVQIRAVSHFKGLEETFKMR